MADLTKKFHRAIIRVLLVFEDYDGNGQRVYCVSAQWNYRYAFSWPLSQFPTEMQPLLKTDYIFIAEVDFLASNEIADGEFGVRNFEVISQNVPSWEELCAQGA